MRAANSHYFAIRRLTANEKNGPLTLSPAYQYFYKDYERLILDAANCRVWNSSCQHVNYGQQFPRFLDPIHCFLRSSGQLLQSNINTNCYVADCTQRHAFKIEWVDD